jgi:uncharacterized membrane protein
MVSRWQWLIKQLTHRLWFRAALLSFLGLITALLAAVIAPLIPVELSAQIGADAVDNILNILASSMLVVTSFSLTTMVAAYSAATNSVTPRATKILLEDPTTQNALSTFIGSFLYSLVGIIALERELYGDQGRAVLFIVTLGVILLIVVTLIRWIDHLSRLGRVGDTTDRIERAAAAALDARIEHPYLGGRRLRDPERDIPSDARELRGPSIGYVQHIDMTALSECAEEHRGEIYVTAVPGTLAEPSRPLAWLRGIEGEEAHKTIVDAFTIDHERSFDQDPRFGLAVLAEIASRALSPAVNDPGTAIDVIGRAVRLLAKWPPGDGAEEPEEIPCPRVYVPPVRVADLFDDVFGPIARDGAALVEVQIRLQKALQTLAKIGDEHFAAHAARHARRALERTNESLALDDERTVVREIAHETLRIAAEA